MADGDPPFRSIEDAWTYHLGEAMPTAEEVSENPMECLRVMFFAGADSALRIAYRHGFTDLVRELKQWCDADKGN